MLACMDHWSLGVGVSGYEVNIVELAKLIDVLKDGAEEVRDANKTLAAVGQLDMLGNDTLKGEAHGFEEKWRWGLDKLDEASDAVIERLESAKKNYEHLEEEYSGLFAGILPGGGGGPSGGGTMPPGGGGTMPNVPGGGYTGGIEDVLGGQA